MLHFPPFSILITLLISFFTTFLVVPLCIRIANVFNILDIPNTTLKVHAKPTPYLGGCAVLIGFFTALISSCTMSNGGFFVGLGILFIVGLMDDVITLQPSVKFGGQLVAIYCFIWSGIYYSNPILPSWLTLGCSLFWMASIINAINLVDVMDGLAISIGLGMALPYFCVALISGQIIPLVMSASLLGSLVAFFCYNKAPASIYLGDAGSLFIGGILAILPFFVSWDLYNPYGLLVPLIISVIPALEITCLIIIRLYKGLSPFQGSADHFKHYLQRKRWTIMEIVGFVFYSSFVSGIISILYYLNVFKLNELVIYAVFCFYVWIYTVYSISLVKSLKIKKF